MSITKLQAESLNLADDFIFTGTVAGAGTAKVQTDDVVKSSSFAKVLSTTIETYEDGSYLVPCSLMC